MDQLGSFDRREVGRCVRTPCGVTRELQDDDQDRHGDSEDTLHGPAWCESAASPLTRENACKKAKFQIIGLPGRYKIDGQPTFFAVTTRSGSRTLNVVPAGPRSNLTRTAGAPTGWNWRLPTCVSPRNSPPSR